MDPKAPSPAPAARPSLFTVATAFLRLGCVAFGGPAMIVHIRRMAVDRRRWLNDAAFREGLSLCQIIPGATAMQTAAYVGLRVRGVAGAVAGFVGFGLPAFSLITVLAALYVAGRQLPPVVAAFSGLRAIVVAVVASAAVSFGRKTLRDWRTAVIAAAAAVLYLLNLHPALTVAAAAGGGVWLFRRRPIVTSSSHPVAPTWKPAAALFAAAAGAAGALFLLDRRLFDLALLAARVDVMAFGGGFASVPLFYHEVVTSLQWLDARTFADGVALGQITPGPIVITAAFVGYLLRGWAGAAAATVGIFTPSLLILVTLAPLYQRLQRRGAFIHAAEGILSSFVGLLAATTWRFGAAVTWDLRHGLLAAAAFLLLLRGVDVAWVIAGGGIASLWLSR